MGKSSVHSSAHRSHFSALIAKGVIVNADIAKISQTYLISYHIFWRLLQFIAVNGVVLERSFRCTLPRKVLKINHFGSGYRAWIRTMNNASKGQYFFERRYRKYLKNI